MIDKTAASLFVIACLSFGLAALIPSATEIMLRVGTFSAACLGLVIMIDVWRE